MHVKFCYAFLEMSSNLPPPPQLLRGSKVSGPHGTNPQNTGPKCKYEKEGNQERCVEVFDPGYILAFNDLKCVRKDGKCQRSDIVKGGKHKRSISKTRKSKRKCGTRRRK